MCLGRGRTGINCVPLTHSGPLGITLIDFQGVWSFLHPLAFFPVSNTQFDWKKQIRQTIFKFLNNSATDERSRGGMSSMFSNITSFGWYFFMTGSGCRGRASGIISLSSFLAWYLLAFTIGSEFCCIGVGNRGSLMAGLTP